MALSPGDQFGPYLLIEPIGRGGMGEVWKARDTRLDRIVAIKFSQEKFSERFEREAKICQLYDVGPNYFVMEYVEGSQLKGGRHCLVRVAEDWDGADNRPLRTARALNTSVDYFRIARHSAAIRLSNYN